MAPRGRQDDPLRFVKDDEARGHVIDLDQVHDALMSKALADDDPAAFALAEIVRLAAAYIAEQRRLSTAR